MQKCIVNTFGPGSVELTKSTSPAIMQVILGWQVDVIAATIRPSDRGIQKLCVAFFSFDFGGRVSLHLCQVLASLAQRYSLCLRGMSCFVQPLHNMTSGFHDNKNVTRKLSSAAKFCVTMWRAVSLMLFLDSDCFNINLWSLLPSSVPFRLF